MKNQKAVYLPKSKRSTLIAKKSSKKQAKFNEPALKNAEQINLVSSDEQSLEILGEEPEVLQQIHSQSEKKSNKKQSTNQLIIPPNSKFNRFNYAVLTKLPIPVPQNSSDPGKTLQTDLQVVVDNNAIGVDKNQSFNYHFSREGSQKEISIKYMHFIQMAQLKLVSNVPKEDAPKKEEENIENVDKKEAIDIDDQFVDKKNRYFEISHEKCFKCNKQGHYAKNCLQEDNRRCKYCFSRLHDERNCPQVCYQCGGTGHIANDCPERRSQRCQRCRHRGHSSSFCGVLLHDSQNLVNLQSLFSQSDLRKMKCINAHQHSNIKLTPHINCFEYKDWPMPYHQLRKGNKKNRHLEEERRDSSLRHSSSQRKKIAISMTQYDGQLSAVVPYDIQRAQQLSRYQIQRSQRGRNNYSEQRYNDRNHHNRNHGNRNNSQKRWQHDQFQRNFDPYTGDRNNYRQRNNPNRPKKNREIIFY